MISVLIPAYNCIPWIEESLRSIAAQTLPAGEILVADDASTDGTADFIESLAIPGVRVLRSERNMGISRQLNRLIDEAKGRHLARMDGDDIAHPERFRLQLDAMERADVGVMGSWSRRFGASRTIHRFAETDDVLKAGLLFSVPFCHPTVVIDRDRLSKPLRYEPDFDLAEDYHLWISMRTHAKYGNLARVVLDWRMHERNAGTSPTTAPRQKELSTRIRRNLLNEYGIQLTEEQFSALDKCALSVKVDLGELRQYADALAVVSQADVRAIGATREGIRAVLADQWDLACAFAAWRFRETPLIWLRTRRRLGCGVDPRIATKLLVKSWLGRMRKAA